MDFSYLGTGFINFHACAKIEIDYILKFKFDIGSKVYDLISARKGVLEAVIVRKVLFNCSHFGRIVFIYKDGDNWLHNEYDLGTETEAINIVIAYHQAKQKDVDDAIAKLNCR